jgi:sulfite reductase (NADPH) hemoprotein beta-component
MYRYDEFDTTLVRERVAQFRGQVERRLAGELTEDEFKPLRLMNGLYLQLHAYMLRIAIPYGTLSSRQLRGLAEIARRFDKGYGHFTTRQNLQLNWPRLTDVPDILGALAELEMHCIQTSGNCIRNVTADPYAGAIAGEIEDPRPTAELIRQWSTLHPEFSFLPRKFKIAVTGAADDDRAAIRLHDIGIEIVRSANGEPGYAIWVGGGQGRTPMLGKRLRAFLPRTELLAYLEAVLRIYNELGRRDNAYKARIKLLVHQLGAEEFGALVEAEYRALDRDGDLKRMAGEISRIAQYFAPPPFAAPRAETTLDTRIASDSDFAAWMERNTLPHRQPGYQIVNISLKPVGGVPGDMTSAQMETVADLARAYSFDELRATHEQNLVLAHVARADLPAVYDALRGAGLATANIGLVSDIICCPGLDYCDLANARSIPIAQEMSRRFADRARAQAIGELKIKISGCINACGHHHVGHIGILGVDKKGTEYYQVTLGGSADETASLGEIVGPAFCEAELPEAIDLIVETYMAGRDDGESFLGFVRRAGLQPFKERLYADH